MRAKSPGKLVLSGAYAILRGAPAVVTAVDRYVVADDSEPASFKTPEVAAALKLLGLDAPHPAFAADDLREDGRKLGLGSSAAICAASVALLTQSRSAFDQLPTDAELAQSIYHLTLHAHREAQGGGSGVDVAAACFGGTLSARLEQRDGMQHLHVEPVTLPKGLVIEIWASPVAASTSHFVKTVFELEKQQSAVFSRLLGAQMEASVRALTAAEDNDLIGYILALKSQYVALRELGDTASVPIVLPEIRTLAETLSEDECFIPSGAGGGDVTLFISNRASSDEFRTQARELQLSLVPLQIGARGVHLLSD